MEAGVCAFAVSCCCESVSADRAVCLQRSVRFCNFPYLGYSG